jgi:hypothetical protein
LRLLSKGLTIIKNHQLRVSGGLSGSVSVMTVILLVLGILFTGAGIVLVGFAVPINASALGQTFIISGTVAIVGGCVLVGLASALTQLARIAASLKEKPVSRTGRVAAAVQRAEEIFPDPRVLDEFQPEPRLAQVQVSQSHIAPNLGQGHIAHSPVSQALPGDLRLPEPVIADSVAAPAAAMPASSSAVASASALERLRATMARPSPTTDLDNVPLSPNGGQHPTAPVLDPQVLETAPSPRPVEPAPRGGSSDTTAKEPRLDFLFRPRPSRPAPSESFDALWPRRGARSAAEPAKIEDGGTMTAVAPPPAPLEDRRSSARVAGTIEESRPNVAILKSGVVDGMAYTLYADGSIEAQLPQGTVRFGSIAELRAHIENNS